jgi:predicted deacylase
MGFHGILSSVMMDEKEFGYRTLRKDLASHVYIPVGIIKGSKNGPVLTITGGLLANEFCGVEAASRLYSMIDPVEIMGTLIVIPVVNMMCLQHRTPWYQIQNSYTPFDGKHLNRCFSGDVDGSPSDVLAYHVLHDYILGSDVHVDFRGGDLHESLVEHTITSVTGGELDKRCIEFANVFGMRFTLPRPSANSAGTLIYETVKMGVPSIISESGLGYKTQPFEEFIQLHIDGTINLMKHLGMMGSQPEKPKSQHFIYDGAKVKAGASGMFHAYLDQGDKVKRGQIIGKITGLDNSMIREVASPVDGLVHEMLPRRLVYPTDTVYSICTVGDPTGYV